MLQGCTPARMWGAAGMMLASATLLNLSPSVFAAPQSGSTAAAVATDGASYWAVLTANAVNIRSGPSAQSAYAFGKLKQGDIVNVIKEEYGWARVRTEGGAFGDIYAFVPADRRVTVSADGLTATVNTRTELRAPNLDAGGSPDKSWKQVGFADAGNTLTVLGTVSGEKESVYKVKVPASAEAWINMQFIRRANEAESAAAVTAANTHAVAVAAPVATAPPTTPVAASPVAPEGGAVLAPVNAPDAGAPAPAAISPEITAGNANSSPAIPPLLGTQPVNASVPTETVSVETTTVTTRTTRPKVVSRRATLDDLEHQFKAVRSQPDASAEFEALLAKYDELATTDDASSSVKSFSNSRAKQLSLYMETQSQVQALERTRSSMNSNKQEIAKLVLDIQRRADFTAIGVLNASAVYDGDRLPELYRVCDPTTGATIAYVEPNADIAMAPMIGTLVGVKGGKSFDPALRLTVIAPLSVDILTLRDTPQVTKSESTRPIEEAGKFEPATTKTTPTP